MPSIIKILGLFIPVLSVFSNECTSSETFIDNNKAELGFSDWNTMMAEKKLIGKGSFGKIYKIPFGVGKFLVLKQQNRDVNGHNMFQRQMDEFKIHTTLWNGPAKNYVPRIYGCVDEDEQLNIFMEFLPHSLTQKTVDTNNEEKEIPNLSFAIFRSFPEHVRFYYYKLMFEGLEKIHEAKYVHNDVKPANILFEVVPVPTIKIIDFGFAEPFDNYPLGGTPIYNDAVKIDFYKSYNKLNFQKSKIKHREEFKKRQDHYMTDIWALAVSIFWIEQIPSPQQYPIEKFNGEDFIRPYERLAHSIRDDKWLKERKLNFCADSEGLNKPMVCFIDVIRKMTGFDRKPVVDTWSIRSNRIYPKKELSEAEKGNQAQPPITMKDLVKDMQRIFNYQSEDFKAKLAEFKAKQSQDEAEMNKNYFQKMKDWVVNLLAAIPFYEGESQKSETGWDMSSDFDFIGGKHII